MQRNALPGSGWILRTDEAGTPEPRLVLWLCPRQDRTADGRAYRMVTIIDEHTREVLMIRVKRKLNAVDAVDALTDLFILRGPPA